MTFTPFCNDLQEQVNLSIVPIIKALLVFELKHDHLLAGKKSTKARDIPRVLPRKLPLLCESPK